MPVVQIKLAGTDITDKVVYSTARFMSQVNGQGGEAHLRVRDLDRSYTPTPGDQLELLIDGDPVWTGFALVPKRIYVFPAINVTDFGLARFYDLDAVDINVLFTKRIVFNQSTPASVLAPLYGPHTADTDVITDLFADWVDLSGDGLDTSSGIEGVGDINEDQNARPWEGSDTLGQAFQSISALPAAIYYIRPNKVLAYVDDDTPDAPFGLSDAPTSGGGGGDVTTSDLFARTEASGWGTGPLGSWTDLAGGFATFVTPGTAFSTGGNAVQMTIPTPASGTNGEVRMRFKWASSFAIMEFVLGTGFPYGSNFADFYMDRTAGQVEIDTNSGFTTGPCPTFSAGDIVWMALRIEADGTIKVKTWLASGSEPGWQATLANADTISVFSQINIVQTGTDDWEFYEVSWTSDTGGGPTTKGYREMEILLDGTNLANDVLAWGAGYGSNVPVFKRAQDSTSISDHNRWQLGQTTFGVYKQSTINRIADSILNGSPAHRRGQKDDRTAIQLVTYEPGLLPAQKVDFISTVFDYEDVIPIRKMEVTFPAPDAPRYELTLSHEIDAPWSFFDPFRYHLPQLPGLPRLPGLPPLPPLPPITGPCLCGMTDDFNRTEASGWATASSGLVWQDGIPGAFSVDGSKGIVNIINGVTSNNVFNVIFGQPCSDLTVQGIVTSDGGSPASNRYAIIGADGGNDGVQVFFATDGTLRMDTYNDTDSTSTAVDPYSPWKVRFQISGGNVQAKVWQASSPEPGSWDLTLAITLEVFTYDFFLGAFVPFPITADISIGYDLLSVPNVDRCTTSVFDDFQRTEGTDWGTPSSGDGSAWAQTHTSTYIVDDHVTPGKGTMVATVNSPGTNPWFGPMQQESTGVTGAMGSFNALIRYRTGTDLATTGYQFNLGQVYININRVNVFGRLLLGVFDGSSVYFNPSEQDLFFDTSDNDILMRVDWDGSRVSLKIWAEENTEPSSYTWSLTRSGGTLFHAGEVVCIVAGTILQADDSVATTALNAAKFPRLDVASINFDYAGKPCFPCSDAATIDDFDRTNPTAWGVAVPDGHTWTMATSGVGSVTYSVDGSQAGIHLPSISDGPGQGSLPIGLQSSGIDWVFTDCSFTSDGRIQIDTNQSVPDPTITVRSLSGRLDLYIEDNSGTVNTNLDLINNHFNFRLVIPADKSRADGYLWLVGSPVPASPTLSIPAVTPGTDNDIDKIIVTGSSESGSTFSMDIKIGEIDSGICMNQPVIFPPGPGYGPYTEVALRNDAITYQLSRAIQPGTLRLYVGTPATILSPTTDYNVDNATGVVTLTTPISDPATPVLATYTAAGPLPSVIATGAIAQFPGTGPNTQAAFISLCNNTAYGIIEIAADTYYGWNLGIRINRTAANPLYVRPAAGADIFWDGTGGIPGQGFMALGANILGPGFPSSVTDFITFDPSGTGGSFTIQNYNIGHVGIILTGWCDHIVLNGFNIVNCTGSGGSFSHCLYINSDHNDVPFNAGHHSTNITANNWTIVGDAGRTLNAIQTFHNPNTIGLSMDNWDVQLVNRWAFLYGDASGISLTNWNGQNCNETIDSPTITADDHATGTVSGCNGNGSCNTLAQGSGVWVNSGIVDGGGNTP